MKLPVWATTVTPLSRFFSFIFFITLPVISFLLGMKYGELKKYAAPIPPGNIIIPAAFPTLTPASITSFQTALQNYCIDGKIPTETLPIYINYDILKVRLDKDIFDHFFSGQAQEQKISCVYEKNTGGYAYLGDNGNGGIIQIFDEQSPDPACMGCAGFTNGEKEGIRLTDEYSLHILPPGSDAPMTTENISVQGMVTKSLTVKDKQEVYINSSVNLIDSEDVRLQNLLSKYKNDSDLGTKSDEIQKDILSAFFSQISSLQEPEKSRLQNLQNILDAFTVKVTHTCTDSNEQCRGKPDGTNCTMGIWCDEQGRICGDQSCTGMATGNCQNNKCVEVNQSCKNEGERGNNFTRQRCCSGLTELAPVIALSDGTGCSPQPKDGSFVCGNCGNELCGPGENRCNCQQDCKQ